MSIVQKTFVWIAVSKQRQSWLEKASQPAGWTWPISSLSCPAIAISAFAHWQCEQQQWMSACTGRLCLQCRLSQNVGTLIWSNIPCYLIWAYLFQLDSHLDGKVSHSWYRYQGSIQGQPDGRGLSISHWTPTKRCRFIHWVCYCIFGLTERISRCFLVLKSFVSCVAIIK